MRQNTLKLLVVDGVLMLDALGGGEVTGDIMDKNILEFVAGVPENSICVVGIGNKEIQMVLEGNKVILPFYISVVNYITVQLKIYTDDGEKETNKLIIVLKNSEEPNESKVFSGKRIEDNERVFKKILDKTLGLELEMKRMAERFESIERELNSLREWVSNYDKDESGEDNSEIPGGTEEEKDIEQN